jgi:hypothetical protein
MESGISVEDLMQHRFYRQLRNAVPRPPARVAVASAVVLAAALTTGVLVNQLDGPGTRANASTVAVADLARANNQLSQDPDPTAAAPAPATSSPAAPTQPATAAPAQAETKKPVPAPPTAKVLDYQYQAQINYYYCGPAATRIALTARDRLLSQDAVAGRLGTTVNGTNSAEDTTRALNSLGKTDFYRTREIPGPSATPAQMDRLQADVVHAISNGFPIVANIVGTTQDTGGGFHAYDGGHYLTVVGYRDNGRTVRIADPANVNGITSYWVTTINMANWMGTRGYSA